LNPSTFELTPQALEEAYQQVITNTGKPPKALLMTNPHNPVGRVMPKQEILDVISWCESKQDFHLISDEIYALSDLSQHLKNNDEHELVSSSSSSGGENKHTAAASSSFVSVGSLCQGKLGNYKHVLWGMSKDFGMSGLRFGLVYTQNKVLYDAMSNVAAFNSIPGPVQVNSISFFFLSSFTPPPPPFSPNSLLVF
jgi:aspartate/methionine/tyrosine aminotransferase